MDSPGIIASRFNASPPGCVKPIVSLSRLWIGLLAVSAFGADAGLDALLKSVESRYNKAKTLQVLFTETYTPNGRGARIESGTLLLRKPGRMRWEYSQPKGKLFVCDGKDLWLYTPADNRVEKMKMQVTDDLRAPLAFLLGKLNFQKEFVNLKGHAEEGGTRVTAEPKTENLPYSAVEFLVSPQAVIRQVRVTGFDKSILEFVFDGEKMDPSLDSKLFQFKPIPGAQVVEAGQ